jgi:hypothetical protein
MKLFSLQPPSFMWVLLFSLMTHFFVAHHNGSVTLTLSQNTHHQIILESGLKHAIEHHSESVNPHFYKDHHESEHDHDLYLEHPEWYNFQANNLIIDSLNTHLAYVPVRLVVFNIFESGFNPDALEHVYLERDPPSLSRDVVLSNTILLI